MPTLTNLLLSYSGGLQVAEPDFIAHVASSIPSDPWYAGAPQKSLTYIGMPSAWDYEVGDADQTVAVIDNGVDYWRCDLGGGIGVGMKVIGGWDYTGYTDPCTGLPQIPSMPGVFHDSWHGTQVASVIGAYSNNIGCDEESGSAHALAGIAGGWGSAGGAASRGTGVNILAYNCGIGGGDLDGASLASAILEAVASSAHGHYGHGVDVVNNSWYDDDQLAVRNGVAEAYWNAASFIAAKGNNAVVWKNPINYPSDYEPSSEVIGVGATDNLQVNPHGLPSRDYYSQWNNHVDLLAPGGLQYNDGTHLSQHLVYALQYDINDCVAGPSGNPDAGAWFEMTSAATAQVSGVAALIRGYLDHHARQVYAREDPEGMLKASAADITGTDPQDGWTYLTGYDDHTGWGMLRADHILKMLDPAGPDAYKLLHIEVPATSVSYGSWSNLKTNVIFYNANDKNTIPISNTYDVKVREVTGTASYAGLGINTSKPVYVWGNTNDINHRGLANLLPNWDEPWCEVTSGQSGNQDVTLGGHTNVGVPGISHEYSTTVSVHTYQYDLWYANGGAHVGHLPDDAKVGMGFTVFGSSASSGVAQPESATNFRVWPSVASTHVLITLKESVKGTSFDLVDALGRSVVTYPLLPGNLSFEISVADLASGLYICRLTSETGVDETKIIVRH